MTPITRMAWFAAVAALALPPAAAAQRSGEITFYSDMAFRGRTFTVSGPRENINIPWKVRSARLSGGAWEICTRSGYRGQCNQVSRDQGNIAWTVASARPSGAAPVPLPQPLPRPPPAATSLRGMSAEFFPAPGDRGGRVPSCPSGAAACAAEAADRFCQRQGWTASSYERQETVSGRIYLADVLCTRTR